MSSRFDDDVEIAPKHLESSFLRFDATRRDNAAVQRTPPSSSSPTISLWSQLFLVTTKRENHRESMTRNWLDGVRWACIFVAGTANREHQKDFSTVSLEHQWMMIESLTSLSLT